MVRLRDSKHFDREFGFDIFQFLNGTIKSSEMEELSREFVSFNS